LTSFSAIGRKLRCPLNAMARDSKVQYSALRYARCAPGTVAHIDFTQLGTGLSFLGSTHGGVRWTAVRCATLSARTGMTGIALAPVPTTATFLPDRSTS